MKKVVQKVALVAHISITFVFVLICILMLFNLIDVRYDNGIVVDSIVLVLVVALTTVYAGLSLYLIYGAFDQRNVIRQVLLYSDCDSSTKVNGRVLKKIAVDNSKMVSGVRVKKVQISPDEKLGFKMKLFVKLTGEEAAKNLDTLRCLCQESFREELGLKFSAVDFRIVKYKSGYKPDLARAQRHAENMAEERKQTKEFYEEPLSERVEDEAEGKKADG